MKFKIPLIVALSFAVLPTIANSVESSSIQCFDTEETLELGSRGPASAVPHSRKHETNFGNLLKLDFSLSSLLEFKDLPLVKRSGIEVGTNHYRLFEQSPKVLYNGDLLSQSIKQDNVYVPTSIELFRFPKTEF